MSFVKHPGFVNGLSEEFYTGIGSCSGLFLVKHSPTDLFPNKYVITHSIGLRYKSKGSISTTFYRTTMYTSNHVAHGSDFEKTFTVYISNDKKYWLYHIDSRWIISENLSIIAPVSCFSSSNLPERYGQVVVFSRSDGQSVELEIDYKCWTCDSLTGVYLPEGGETGTRYVGTPTDTEDGGVVEYQDTDETQVVYVGNIASWRS